MAFPPPEDGGVAPDRRGRGVRRDGLGLVGLPDYDELAAVLCDEVTVTPERAVPSGSRSRWRCSGRTTTWATPSLAYLLAAARRTPPTRSVPGRSPRCSWPAIGPKSRARHLQLAGLLCGLTGECDLELLQDLATELEATGRLTPLPAAVVRRREQEQRASLESIF